MRNDFLTGSSHPAIAARLRALKGPVRDAGDGRTASS
jgi:hypothetical protein